MLSFSAVRLKEHNQRMRFYSQKVKERMPDLVSYSNILSQLKNETQLLTKMKNLIFRDLYNTLIYVVQIKISVQYNPKMGVVFVKNNKQLLYS